MSMFIRIYYSGCFKDISMSDLQRFSIGSNVKDGFTIENSDLKKEHIKFIHRNDEWEVSCIGEVYMNGNKVTKGNLMPGQIFILSKQHRISMLVIEDYPETGIVMKLNADEITIGRDEKCNIALSSPIVSSRHAKIKKMGSSYHVIDTNSMNGTYVGSNSVSDYILKNHDEIVIGESKIVFRGDCLELYGVANKVEIHESKPKSRDVKEAPIYKRSPRLKLDVPNEKIDVQNPPNIGSKPELNWISILTYPLIMGVMAGVSYFTTGNLPLTIIFACAMPLSAILTYRMQTKKHRNNEKLRLNKYKDYLINTQNKIDEVHAKQLHALTSANPKTSDCYELVKNMSSRMWERSPHDADFMTLRVGSGKVKSAVEIKVPNETLSLHEDELANKGKQIAIDNEFVEDAPILCDIKSNCMVGIVGDRANNVKLAKNLIIQATTLHSYEELRLVTVFPRKEMKEWDWVRWLPHSFDSARSYRYIASNDAEISELSKKFEDIIKDRRSEIGENRSGRRITPLPYYLFVIADIDAFDNHSVMSAIRECDPQMGIGALILTHNKNDLHMECKEIIELHNNSGVVYNAENSNIFEEFKIDPVDNKMYNALARAMAPVRVEEKGKSTQLPTCVTFLDGYDVKMPSEVALAERWRKAQPFKTMAVPVGIRENGEKFYFDIHEKKHGPHGLVAGTTGSGKSEMVQSWILSMAMTFSPSDVSFVLIDFKGTGLIKPFEKLPHLAGTISNIDKKIHRNLVALECELTRRQILFNKYGVQNISDYQKLYHKGQAEEALSALFIVIDEFAEFKAQFPEFMGIIDRTFAIGRTLGVFIVLLTQKPAGVVSDKMNANTRFRWCLKVANKGDSNDMLHHPDAAKITVPGRAYVQVGEDEIYEEIQSFWSGAPYNPNKKDKMTVVPKISGLSLNGKRITYKNRNKTVGIDYEEKDEIKEINAVVDYLNSYVEENQIPKARKVWTDKLEDIIGLNEIIEFKFNEEGWAENDGELTPVIGLIDDPRKQAQYPACVDLSGEGHVGIYGAPSTGKTTLLQTLIMSMVCTYSPEDVNIYVMDFNTWGLGMFANYPHVGGVVNDNEEEKVDKLIKLISKELDVRREKFSKHNVGSIKSYRETTGEKLPYIALIVDNFAPVFQLYPETDSFFLNLTRQGGSYGIYLIATANNTNALTYKISQNIKNSIALQMNDKSDYAALVGKTNGLEPDSTDGRGLIKAETPLEFQTALPAAGDTDSDRVLTIKKIAEEMNKCWTGKRANPIPVMPDIIDFNSVSCDKITIGLLTNEVYPVGINFEKSHYMSIAGFPQSGKSNMIKVIAKQMKNQNEEIEIVVYDSDNGLESIRGIVDKYYVTGSELDDYMAEIVNELGRRKEIYDSGETEEFKPIAIFVDGFRKCYEDIDEKTAKRLEMVIKLGTGLNVYFIVSENSEELAKLSSMGNVISMLLVGSNLNIVLGHKFKAHTVFKADLPYNEAEAKLDEFEGFVIKDEHAERFKAMFEK